MSQVLIAAGFVRVDGLTQRSINGEERVIKHEKEDWGSICSNNFVTCVVTNEGQTWIAYFTQVHRLRALDLRLRPIFVPGSNQEQFRTGDLLIRIQDPFWDADQKRAA